MSLNGTAILNAKSNFLYSTYIHDDCSKVTNPKINIFLTMILAHGDVRVLTNLIRLLCHQGDRGNQKKRSSSTLVDGLSHIFSHFTYQHNGDEGLSTTGAQWNDDIFLFRFVHKFNLNRKTRVMNV